MKMPAIKIEKARDMEHGYGKNLNAVYVDVKNKTMAASDGHVLVIAPVNTKGCEKSGIVELSDNGFAAVRDGSVALPQPKPSTEYPKTEPLFTGFKGKPDIMIGAHVLRKLLAALDDEGGEQPIGIWINHDDNVPSSTAMLVAGVGNAKGPVALIMPLRCDITDKDSTAESLIGKVFPK